MMIGNSCLICGGKITVTGRYHKSVCCSQCAKKRSQMVKIANRRKQKGRYIAKNPNYNKSKTWSRAREIWAIEDNQRGNKWTRIFGNIYNEKG